MAFMNAGYWELEIGSECKVLSDIASIEEFESLKALAGRSTIFRRIPFATKERRIFGMSTCLRTYEKAGSDIIVNVLKAKKYNASRIVVIIIRDKNIAKTVIKALLCESEVAFRANFIVIED